MITLGIIGIVASLTLPSLIQDKQDKETVSRLKKAYSSLSQAYLMLLNEYGDPTNWGIVMANTGGSNPTTTPEGTAGSIKLANMFAKYMNTIKICGSDKGCFATSSTVNSRVDFGKILLNDGTALAFAGLSGDCSTNRGNTKNLSSVCAWIVVDVNGSRRPNVYGIDIFEFSLTKYGIIPYGTPEDEATSFKGACKNFRSDINNNGCTAWVLYNENLDYLKCSDLEWGKKIKCK